MKILPISNDTVGAMVDDEDFDKLKSHVWTSLFRKGKIVSVQAKIKCKTTSIARYLMDTPKHMECDHADRNPYNNQKRNLRNCTTSQNRSNRTKSASQYGYKGVYKNKQKFCFMFKHDGKVIYRGNFDTTIEAAIAYDDALLLAKGEFAVTNFPLVVY